MKNISKINKILFRVGLLFLFIFTYVDQGATQVCYELPEDLISWWNADSVSETTAFDIYDGNNGTMEGDVGFVPGIVGNAFSFNGNGRVRGTLSGFTGGDSAITTSAWFNQSSPPSGHPGKGIVGVGQPGMRTHFFQRLSNGIGANDPSYVCMNDVGENRLCLSADDGVEMKWWTSNAEITNDEWHYIATTYSPTSREVKIYIDGILDSIITLSTGLSLMTDFWIGNDAFSDNFFVGLIDEVQIYNRALNENEVFAIYYAGSAGMCSPVSFAEFTMTKTKIKFNKGSGNDSFKVKCDFTIGGDSNGINPLDEDIEVIVGTSILTIPAGSSIEERPGKIMFEGTINNSFVEIVIEQVTVDTFNLEVKAEGVDLTDTSNPVDINVTIGDDTGTANIHMDGVLKLFNNF